MYILFLKVDEATLEKIAGYYAITFQPSKKLGYLSIVDSCPDGDILYHDAAFLADGK